MKKYILGIDVGGTNIKLGIVDCYGNMMIKSNLMTRTYIRSQKKLIAALIQQIRQLLDQSQLKKKQIGGIGIGLPGLINPQKGIVTFLPNIPGWKNVPLKKIIQDAVRYRTYVDNDVNMIALGEWKFGAGKGAANLICMTLGTGVGGGLILDNRLYRGEGFAAGEIGHMPLNEKGPMCNCGGFACFERAVGHRTLQKRGAHLFRKKNITLQEITSLARRGDKRAVRFWEETADHIGNALTGIVNVLNPARVVIGGGVSNCPPLLFKKVQAVIKKRAMQVQGRMVKVVKAKLGDDAGIIGASVLVNEMVAHV